MIYFVCCIVFISANREDCNHSSIFLRRPPELSMDHGIKKGGGEGVSEQSARLAQTGLSFISRDASQFQGRVVSVI